MRLAVTYVYPQLGGDHYLNLAIRFLKTYHEFPPGMDHESIIVCNGQPPVEETAFLFGSLPNVHFTHHDNSAFDIGAYQVAAAEFADRDMMVFFGASTYLRGAGWLARMHDVFAKNGPGLYGTMPNRGNRGYSVSPHLRSTGFWCPPSLINRYPHRITKAEQRYGWEHGSHCFTSWVKSQKLPVLAVSWEGTYREPHWDQIPGGYHNANQSNLICGDRMTEPPYYPVP